VSNFPASSQEGHLVTELETVYLQLVEILEICNF